MLNIDLELEKARKLNKSCYFIFGNDEGMINFVQSTLLAKLGYAKGGIYFFSYKEIMDDPTMLANLMHAPSLFEQHNIVVIEDIAENVPESLEWIFKKSNYCQVIIAAGETKKSSKLYQKVAANENILLLACYQMDKKDIVQYIQNFINNAGKTINYDLCCYIAELMPNNMMFLHNELSKLILYIGSNKEIGHEDCSKVFGNNEIFVLDQVSAALVLKDKEYIKNKLDNLISNEEDYMLIVRVLASYIKRLIHAKQMLEEGSSVEQALQKLKPAVFFKYKTVFIQALNGSSMARLKKLLKLIIAMELDIKQYSYNKKEYFAQALLELLS